jgi:hypothetical protein
LGQASPEGTTPVSTYLLGALIILILGVISMLVADFGGVYWYDYYNGIEGRYWINIWGAAFLLIVPIALVMLYMAYWSSQAMRDASKITVNALDRWFKVSLVIGGLYVLFGIIFAAVAIWDDYNDWWLDVGFYGGLIGGFLAALFFNLAKKQAVAQGYPEGDVVPLVPYPLSTEQSSAQQAPPYQPPVHQPPVQQPPVHQPPAQQPPAQQPPVQQPPAQQPPAQQPPVQQPYTQQPPAQQPPAQQPPVQQPYTQQPPAKRPPAQ